MNDIFDKITLPETITEEKAEFLREAIKNGTDLKKSELIPYFTSLIRKANQQKISFTNEEVQFIVMAIRAGASAADQEKIDLLLNYGKKDANQSKDT